MSDKQISLLIARLERSKPPPRGIWPHLARLHGFTDEDWSARDEATFIQARLQTRERLRGGSWDLR